jgi:hypothetical protein
VINGGTEVITMEIERIWETIVCIILAVAGGFSRLLQKKDKSRIQWSRIFSELFVSGFSGLMLLLFARSFGLEGDWLGLVCGIAGYIGPRILDIVAKPVGKSIGIDIETNDSKDRKDNNA